MLCFKNYAKRKTKIIDKTVGELRDDSLTSDSANAASVKNIQRLPGILLIQDPCSISSTQRMQFA